MFRQRAHQARASDLGNLSLAFARVLERSVLDRMTIDVWGFSPRNPSQTCRKEANLSHPLDSLTI
jgi:hypothetical protein